MRETILIIEDEADVAGLLRYNFSKAGFSVLVAGNGIEGLEIVSYSSRVAELQGQGLSKRAIARAIGIAPSNVMRLLAKAA